MGRKEAETNVAVGAEEVEDVEQRKERNDIGKLSIRDECDESL